MTENSKSEDAVKKIGDFIKTWLPIAITIGGLVTGYFVFKAETRHQFELQRVEMTSLHTEVRTLREQIEENRREWQHGVEEELRRLREDAIRRDFRIQNLESNNGSNRNFSPSPSRRSMDLNEIISSE